MNPSTDRIEKSLLLKAPRSRVWRALADSAEFGRWFGCELTGPFTVGSTVRGRLTIQGYDHLSIELVVERLEPERHFAYRWHPYAVDPTVDYASEATTLVEFTLDESEGGTRLRVVESGFDKIPASRRAEAFRMNDQGWSAQLESIARHVQTTR